MLLGGTNRHVQVCERHNEDGGLPSGPSVLVYLVFRGLRASYCCDSTSSSRTVDLDEQSTHDDVL